MFWGWQSRQRQGTVQRDQDGHGLRAAGHFVLASDVYHAPACGRIRGSISLWLVGCTLIYTLGELYLSPVGLSLVTKVAPARLVGMLMGMWFLSNFFGNYLSGYLGTYYEKMSRESFFLMLAVLGVSRARRFLC